MFQNTPKVKVRNDVYNRVEMVRAHNTIGLTPQIRPKDVMLSLTSSHDRQNAVGQGAW